MSTDSRATLSFPLVGRSTELASLRQWLDQEGRGPRPAVFLRGEGGVGKSRLAEAVADDARRKEWTVVEGRAYPVESGAPYALLSDAFVPWLRELGPDALMTLTRGGLDALHTIFPALGPSPTGAPAADGSPDELKTRLYWNFSELVRALSERAPVLVLLEDLQWADATSLELFHFLARQLDGARVRVLATYNDTHRDDNPALAPTERSLSAQELVRVIHLAPLDRAETGEMIEQAFDVDSALIAGFVDRLHTWTGGNPFFIEETLKALVDDGRLSRREGAWVGWDTRDLVLPATIREAVLQRTRRLPEEALEVANVAAVLGSRISFPQLRAASSLSERDLLAGLDELRSRKLIRERLQDEEVWYDFTHPLVRETLYGELGLARTRVLHATVAEALEGLYADRADEHADELAFHFDRAGSESSPEKAALYLVTAGRQAFRRSAYAEAADLLGSALPRLRDEGPGDMARPALRLDVLEELAWARQAVGQADAALTLLTEARDASEEPGRRARLDRRAAMVHFFAGRHRHALEAVASGEVPATEAGLDHERARLLLIRGLCLEQLGNAGAARATLDEVLGLAEALGDDGLRAKAHRALALGSLWVGRPDEVRMHATEAIRLAESDGGSVLFWSYWVLAVLEGLTGNVDRMPALIDAAEKIAGELRSPQLGLWAAELRIELASAACDWDRGLLVGEQAIELARRLGQGALLPRLLVWTSLIYVGRGDFKRARQLLEDAWSVSGAGAPAETVDVHAVVPVHTGMATYHLFQGDYATAVEYARAGLEIADRSGYFIWAIHRLLPSLAESVLGQRDLDAAREIGARLRRDSERLGHRLGVAWSDACDAIVLWLSGDLENGIVGLRAAAEALEAVPFVWDAARVRRQLAGRLAETGRSEEALAELRRVHDTFGRIGARRELSRTREMFRELGTRPPARSSPAGAGAGSLTSREVEIARLVSERKSNKAIAKVLEISPRTVSTHLSNIYKKVGVRSRGELTDLVRTSVLLEG